MDPKHKFSSKMHKNKKHKRQDKSDPNHNFSEDESDEVTITQKETSNTNTDDYVFSHGSKLRHKRWRSRRSKSISSSDEHSDDAIEKGIKSRSRKHVHNRPKGADEEFYEKYESKYHKHCRQQRSRFSSHITEMKNIIKKPKMSYKSTHQDMKHEKKHLDKQHRKKDNLEDVESDPSSESVESTTDHGAGHDTETAEYQYHQAKQDTLSPETLPKPDGLTNKKEKNSNKVESFIAESPRPTDNVTTSHSHSSHYQSTHNKIAHLKTSVASRKSEVLDFNFDFIKYKYSLNRIFMRDSFFSKITDRHSKEHEDFWAFMTRYQAYQQKKTQLTKGQPTKKASTSGVGHLDLPQNYDVQYRVNISFLCKDFDVFLKKGRLVDYQIEKELTRERVIQFRSILLHFLDFQQKQKFLKLHKIRQDQNNLPIYQYKKKMLEMIKQHQVIVVAGDTGCGKSTQVPQYLLEAGFDKIACTQPRRIACISLAKRVGYETLNEFGSEVAYQVRFEKSKTAATKILFLTEGLLLRQMTTDPLLEMYSVVVIDEVHERHMFTDFLLGILKCVLMKRSDLKLVLMSATININLFSDYFNGAPVIKVPGRLYPIEMQYCPIKRDEGEETRRIDPTPYLRLMQRIDHKYPSAERGDLLIFLSGMSEIVAVVEAAKAYAQQMKGWIVLPLHSALSVEEQDKVFDIAPDGVRKCIVSTNIAETSVTIDGVRFIIDSGKVKEMSFDPKYKMQKLQEFWISRASSEQRKGRAGRTGPGVCYRLYGESEYNDFQDYSTPELQRMPLDSLILQMISMGLPDARKFPFIEPPSMTNLENSITFLKEQGALTSTETLTPIGQMLSMLPVDVVVGKMLIMGSMFNMIDPVLSITAAMSVQSPFTNRAYTDHEAITARKPLESDHGDPFTLLNAFDEWIQVKAQGQGTRSWSRRRGLEEQRFYEMTKLKRQFKDLLRDHHLLDGGDDRQRYLTSDERRVQHGERKRLGELRKVKMREKKRRKVLSMEDEEYKISDEEGNENGGDIKDLEFRLSNDLSQLQETSNRSRSFTLRDINLMKIILCSGLYPQVAIADDCNTFKRDSDQAFHTKNKPFILMHPNSIFTAQPDLLMPKNSCGQRPSASELKGLLSAKHELITYVSLLETKNKPYLMNLMRVPALQTVTLFSNSIDTNIDCTRLICDGWLEVKFPSIDQAEMVVSSIMQLRSTWHSLLKVRLQDTFEGIEEERRVSPRARHLERLLASKLTEFLNSDILYSLRRVLPAEMQRVYTGPGKGATSGSKFVKYGNQQVEEHPFKGGAQVTDYLTFNCLLDETTASVWGEFTANMQRHWTCTQCGQSMIVTVLERLQHEAQCSLEDGKGLKCQEEAESEKERQTSLDPMRKPYFCMECQEHLSLTTIEILKHRKSHVT